MKKLMLTLAAIGLFFTTSTQAQVEDETSTEVTTQEKQHQDYAQIEISELPEAVTTALNRDYPGAVAKEAYIKEKDGKTVYKLKLDVNGEEQKVFADAQGNWIDKDDKKDYQSKDS